MYVSKKSILLSFMAFAGFGLVAGVLLSANMGGVAHAQNSCVVDEALLTELYDSVFHRPLDAGANAHIGRDVNTVLNALQTSEEHAQYSGLFKAMKALEEAERAPGELSDTEKDQYTKILDSALSTAHQWSKTLPEQAEADAVVGPAQAKSAIQAAYDNMNATAQENAKFGLFNALEQIGRPSDLAAPDFNAGKADAAGDAASSGQ